MEPVASNLQDIHPDRLETLSARTESSVTHLLTDDATRDESLQDDHISAKASSTEEGPTRRPIALLSMAAKSMKRKLHPAADMELGDEGQQNGPSTLPAVTLFNSIRKQVNARTHRRARRGSVPEPMNLWDFLQRFKLVFLDSSGNWSPMRPVRLLFESSWVLLMLLGFLTSLLAWSIDVAVEKLFFLHDFLATKASSSLMSCAVWLVVRVLYLLVAVGIAHFLLPGMTGSGIPEVRSVLDGFPIKGFLSRKALIGKVLGLTFALGSGLPIGKEGPFVHLGCIVATQMSKWRIFLQITRCPELLQHILTSACVVGVTATYGAPVGGVLFSIEVTRSFYMTTNYWRAFFCSVCGFLMFHQLRKFNSSPNTVSLVTTHFSPLPFSPYELPAFLLLSILCGLLSGIFVHTYMTFVRVKRRYQGHWLVKNVYLWGVLVALVTGLVEYPWGPFMRTTMNRSIQDLFASSSLGDKDSEELIKAGWTKPSLALNLAAFCGLRFISTAACGSLSITAGVVTPVFAIGAGLGRFFGEIVSLLTGNSSLAGGYAVVGAASFTAGVTGSVSVAVIVFEMTSQLSYSIPVLLAVIVGRGTSLLISSNIYDSLAGELSLPSWPAMWRQHSFSLYATDLMRSESGCMVPRSIDRPSLRLLLSSYEDTNIFPVVESLTAPIYLGAVARYDLQGLLDIWDLCVRHTPPSSIPTFGGARAPTIGAVPTAAEGPSDEELESGVLPGSSPLSSGQPMVDHALRNLSPEQRRVLALDEEMDIFGLNLLQMDAVAFHVSKNTLLSRVVFLFAAHKQDRVFITSNGKLLGFVDAADCHNL